MLRCSKQKCTIRYISCGGGVSFSPFCGWCREGFFLSVLVGGCMIYPESVALQTAAVLQAEARGCYPAAALCAASIIQRVTNSIKSRREGRNYVSVVGGEVH